MNDMTGLIESPAITREFMLTNVCDQGFCFGVDESNGEGIFISRQLTTAKGLTEEDVGSTFHGLVRISEKGPAALTLYSGPKIVDHQPKPKTFGTPPADAPKTVGLPLPKGYAAHKSRPVSRVCDVYLDCSVEDGNVLLRTTPVESGNLHVVTLTRKDLLDMLIALEA